MPQGVFSIANLVKYMQFLPPYLKNKPFPDEPIKTCVFSCKADPKGLLLSITFCSVVPVAFLLKFRSC